MRRLFLLLFALCSVSLAAQPTSDEDFRARIWTIVSEGNRQYLKGNRDGILAALESLQQEMGQRIQDGLLKEEDSLEFTADFYKLLGDWYYENSFWEEADNNHLLSELSFQKALDIYQENSIFRQDLDKIPLINRELAQLYYKEGEYQQAYDAISEAEKAYSRAYGNLFVKGDKQYADWLDIRMQQALCLARLGRVAEAGKQADAVIGLVPKKSERYYESLRKKAKILVLGGDTGKALPLYKAYFDWRKADAISTLKTLTAEQRQNYWMKMRPFVTDCYLLEGKDPGFLYDVSLFSKGLLLQMNLFDKDSRTLKNLSYTWKDIQKNLPEGSCSIEYLQYEKGGKKKMAAVVVSKTGTPVWVELADPDELMAYKVMHQPVSRILQHSSDRPYMVNYMYKDEGLKRLIWPETLEKAMGKSRKVYFSPDGYYHQLAAEYLLPPGMEDLECHRLSSSRQIILKRNLSLDSAFICGGIEYQNKLSEQPVGNDSLAFRIWERSYFDNLTNTKTEVEDIVALRECPKDTLLMGTDATEETVRNLVGRYSLVHLATHGGFNSVDAPVGTDLKPCLTERAMSESVIVLSGANRTLRNSQYNPIRQDGILSAWEIAELDMTRTDLAVISACQTNLGHVTSDGIYGIQRGLKNAGVGGMILSLWSVDDVGTYLQMSRFYANLQQGMDIYSAFNAARDAWDSEVAYSNMNQPCVKNAFILIDVL